MTYLPPRVASWRYARGQRSLISNLSGTEVSIVEPMGTKNVTVGGTLSTPPDNGGDDEDEDVPDELEDIVDHLLRSLQDKDTIVRWSAAKGIGRITMRLCKDLGDDVVEALLELFQDENDDSAWHGGCLALAELTRRGLLLPERLQAVMPLIEKAIHFDVIRGQHSVGAHVRDAACYVCWAFARAYSPAVMRPFIGHISESMLITCLYDREINCRRAASAAFQENVGRQGNENFPNGIEIITVADFFSLGNRSHSYMHVAPLVAAMSDRNHEVMMFHLLDVKCGHWDVDIRRLAAHAMAVLVPLNPTRSLEILSELLQQCFSTSFATRHGSVLAVAEVILALTQSNVSLTENSLEKVTQLVPALDKARLFRGKGGELLRAACCNLIEHIAKSQLLIPIKTKFILIEFLNENLRNPIEYIQTAAVDALRELTWSYFAFHTNRVSKLQEMPSGQDSEVGTTSGDVDAESTRLNTGAVNPAILQKVQKLTIETYLAALNTEDNVAVTRGYCLALGALPPRLLCAPTGQLDKVFNALSKMAEKDRKIGGDADAETRRNAVAGVVEILEKLCMTEYFTVPLLTRSFTILKLATQDYSVDKRGDTGSWSRVVAIKGILRLIYAGIRHAAALNDCTTNSKYCTVPIACRQAYKQNAELYSSKLRVDGTLPDAFLLAPHYVFTSFGPALLTSESITGHANAIAEIANETVPKQTSSQQPTVPTVLFHQIYYLCASSGRERSDLIQAATSNASVVHTTFLGLPASIHSQRIYAVEALNPLVGEHLNNADTAAAFLTWVAEHAPLYIGILLAQLAEKLDAVREVAGVCLENLIFSKEPVINDVSKSSVSDVSSTAMKTQSMLTQPVGVGCEVPGIVDRARLVQAISFANIDTTTSNPLDSEAINTLSSRDLSHAAHVPINWAHPAHVFPVLRRIMESQT